MHLFAAMQRPNPEMLEQNCLFAGVPEEKIRQFCEELEVRHFAAKDVIFEEAQAGDCLYLLAEGSVRISKIGRGGNQETLGFIEAGDFFGEMALIDGKPRSAQASAATPATLVRVDAGMLRRILQAAPDGLQMNFVRSIVERLRGADSHFIAELTRQERLSTIGAMANSILHDMKNPITVVKGCAELIGMKSDTAAMKEFSRVIGTAVQRMEDMIQELLDFARGQSSLHFARARATAVLEELDPQLHHLIPKEVHVIRECRCDSSIMADIGRFSRVLLNLIKNAVEAMPKGGVLVIALLEDARHAIFKVSDTGVGIPEELLPRIFEPFITHGKSKGTGLGLAIAKNVVEAHSGTISIQSVAGTGTTFEIRLPFAMA
jgi:signal transduction histidine kinase